MLVSICDGSIYRVFRMSGPIKMSMKWSLCRWRPMSNYSRKLDCYLVSWTMRSNASHWIPSVNLLLSIGLLNGVCPAENDKPRRTAYGLPVELRSPVTLMKFYARYFSSSPVSLFILGRGCNRTWSAEVFVHTLEHIYIYIYFWLESNL